FWMVSWFGLWPTQSSGDAGGSVLAKFAFTVLSASSVTVHAPAPEQAPVQPVNDESWPAAAVSVIDCPLSTVTVHVEGQLMPPPRTDPPVVTFTVSVTFGIALTCSVTDVVACCPSGIVAWTLTWKVRALAQWCVTS